VIAALVLAVVGCAQPDTTGDRSEAPPLRFTYEPVRPHTEAVPGIGEAHDVAQRFARAWVRTDLSTTAWRDALAAHATSDFADRLRQLERDTGAATALRGPVAPVRSAPAEVEFAAQTDAGTLLITTVSSADRWLIHGTSSRAATMPASSA
jgi:hypothetical protein